MVVIRHCQPSVLVIARIRLVGGLNTVTTEQFARLENNKAFLEAVDSGRIEVIEGKSAVDRAISAAPKKKEAVNEAVTLESQPLPPDPAGVPGAGGFTSGAKPADKVAGQ